MSEHLNMQEAKTGKIYGIIKMGANNTDKILIKKLQQDGYDEHEIQRESGVHHAVIRSFMVLNDPNFEMTEAPPTADTQHLHDNIASLTAKLAAAESKSVEDEAKLAAAESKLAGDEDEDEDEDEE